MTSTLLAALGRLDCAGASKLASGSGLDIEMHTATTLIPPHMTLIWQVCSRSHARLCLRDHTGGPAYPFPIVPSYAARITHVLPLLRAYHGRREAEPGFVLLQLGDLSRIPSGLGFCANIGEVNLIPNSMFLQSGGYREARMIYWEVDAAWDQKTPIAIWRGSATGVAANGWRDLQRVRLCEIVSEHSLFDVGLSNAVPGFGQNAVDEMNASPWMRGRIDWREFVQYKYQIDIDGYTNSWPGLFLKLLTGSPVLKVASERGFRQWYYDRLVPWQNFVPVRADMSDLIERAEWLATHDDDARAIGREGRALAESLDYEGELIRAVPTIRRAMAATVNELAAADC